MRAALLGVLAALLIVPPAHAADAVVGFVDTGINPYHQEFRDTSPRAYQHPSTYLPGFPADAKALNLTFGAETWEDAVLADCEVWKNIEERTLYWIPGTKIVGAISFFVAAEGDVPEFSCDETGIAGARILDTNGHGTMVASRAAANDYGACRTCRIVSIHYPNNGTEAPEPYQAALRWAAANRTWLDVQSNSWGPIVPAHEPTGTNILASNPPLVRSIEATASVQMAFWASMNGAAGRGGVLGHPTPLSPHLTPSVLSVGGHDSGYMTLWPGFPPHVAADACNAFGAYHDHLDKSDGTVSSGTSGATPYVAGGAAQILSLARGILGYTPTGMRGDVVASGPAGRVPSGPLADGVFTLAEWRRLVLETASRRPESQPEDAEVCAASGYDATPVKWTDVPDEYPEYLNIGYGAVDRNAVQEARKILLGEADPPDRTATDEYFATDDQLRRQLHEEYTLGEHEDPPAAVPLPEPSGEAVPLPGPGGGAPPSAAPPAKPAAAAPRAARLSDLVRVTCRAGKLSFRLRPSVRSARIAVGRAKPRVLRRGTLRLAGPRARRTPVTVTATGRDGSALRATGAVGRCVRR